MREWFNLEAIEKRTVYDTRHIERVRSSAGAIVSVHVHIKNPTMAPRVWLRKGTHLIDRKSVV